MSRSSIALSNLRAVVIVIVLAFHSVLAYLASLPAGAYRFDDAPYRWQAIPIVDSQRWFGFDLFCAWQDVSLMSLMFFLSGLFVPSSLARKGSMTFLSDRFFRIGLPLVLVVVFLMPVTYYPTYLRHRRRSERRRLLATSDGAAVLAVRPAVVPVAASGAQRAGGRAASLRARDGAKASARLAASARAHPIRFFVALVALSALAYVPLALIYSPWAWTSYGPFSFQLSRPLHYLVYFFAGCAVGAYGLDRGLLASDGALARHWAGWLAASVAGFVLWALPTSLMVDGREAPLIVQTAAALGFVLACASGCFVLLALCLRFAPERTRILDSLSVNAYSMYLLHYVFIVWLQYALLPVALFAAGKAAIVFGGTLALSWAAAVAFGNVAWDDHLAQAKRWMRASFGDPAPAKLVKQDDLTG